MNKENGFKLNTERPVPAPSLPRVVIATKDKFLIAINALLTKMLDSADDALFELADKAQSQTLQTQYFDAMRELRIKRRGVETRFAQQLQSGFDALGRDDSWPVDSSKVISFDNLTLVQHEQLEENLAVEGMVSKARARYLPELNQLIGRFEVLIAKGIDLEKSPFDPAALCHSFHQSCELIALDIQSKLIIYKLFERFVLANLSGCYQQLNQFLSQSGLVSEQEQIAAIRSRAVKPTMESMPLESAFDTAMAHGYAAPAPVAMPSLADVAVQQASTSTALPADSLSFSSLQAMLSAQRQLLNQELGSIPASREHFAAAAASIAMPYLPTQRLLSTLSQLQQRSESIQASAQIRQLLQHYTEHAGQKVERNDQDAIDIVSMLFDFILGDANLPAEFKLHLSRLQIPYIKLALLDKNFFAQKQHPARRLLNLLSQTAVGWNREDREGNSELALKIEAMVQRVLLEFEDNPEIFSSLLTEFEQFVNLQQQKTRLLEQRLREAEEGKAKAQFARQKAEIEIIQRLANTGLPDELWQLLRQDWGQVLFLTFLREGEQSQTWRIRVAVLDRLRQLPQRSLTELDDSRELIRAQLQEGLDSISTESFKLAALLEAVSSYVELLKSRLVAPIPPEVVSAIASEAPLAVTAVGTPDSAAVILPSPSPVPAGQSSSSELHVTEPLSVAQPQIADTSTPPVEAWQQIADRLKRNTVDAALAASTVSRQVVSPVAEAALKEPAPIIEDQYWQQVQDLGTGTWLELTLNGNPTRCKLAAKIALADKYICVNRAGVKVAELSRAEFAQALRSGAAIVLDDSAVFERALQSVISSLQQQEPQWS